jgi:hypothetical protein
MCKQLLFVVRDSPCRLVPHFDIATVLMLALQLNKP